MDAAAAGLGLAVGMPLADARALVPGLQVADAAPEADARSLTGLADWCTRYAPWSATDGADGIRLDITGAAHLFGGEAAMLADMERRLGAFGFLAHGAVADTPAAAWGWARYRPGQCPPILESGDTESLMALPVAALRLDGDSLETLAVLGLATIGAVIALPRAPLGRRLGPAALLRLDRMFGRAPEPISPRPPAEPFVSRAIFAEPIGRREDIDAAAERLSAHLCRDLALRGRGARRLSLAFYRVDGAVQQIAVGTSGPSHAPEHMLRLFAERLGTVAPGFGIEAMVLEATVTEPLAPVQAAMSADGEIDPVALAALIDRLQNRLGRDRVVQPIAVESHIPERAETYLPASSSGEHRKSASPLEGEVGPQGRVGGNVEAFCTSSVKLRQHPPPVDAAHRRPPPQGGRRSKTVCGVSSHPLKPLRPLTLLPFPEPVEATAPVPDDPPLFFRWRRNLHRVALADGPERIGPEWWLLSAGKPRDYYRVEDTDGRRFWLYREGLYGAAEPPRWFLHGFFP